MQEENRGVRMSGFSAMLGNPPFINAWAQHELIPHSRSFLSANNPGFLIKHWDLSSAFVIKSIHSSNCFAFILPTSLLLQPHGEPIRRYFCSTKSQVIDWTGKRWFPDAAVEVFSVSSNSQTELNTFQKWNGVGKNGMTSIAPLLDLFMIDQNDTTYIPNPVSYSASLELISSELGSHVYINYGAQVSPKKKGGSKSDNIFTSLESCENPKIYTEAKYLQKNSEHLEWTESQYLNYVKENLYGPRTEELFESPKLVIMRLSQGELPVWYDESGIYLNHSVLVATLHETLPESFRKYFDYTPVSIYNLKHLNLLLRNKYSVQHYLSHLKQGTDNYPKSVRKILIPNVPPSFLDECLAKENMEDSIVMLEKEIERMMD
jgi:hypothetical protein